MNTLVARLLLAVSVIMPCTVAAADKYPSRPIRLIVPFSAGGPTDNMARLVADHLGKRLDQTITVINKPGGDNIIAARELLSSEPDGYSLLFITNGLLTIAPAIHEKYAINTLDDFSYIGSISAYPYVFVTGVNNPRTNLQSFIQDSRDKPESVSYAVVGNVSMVAGAMFTRSAGVQMLPVRYKGNSDTVSDLYAGRLDLGSFAPSFSIPLAQSGKVSLLAVTGSQRLAKYPDVPLVSEIDPALADFAEHAMVWTAIVAPAKTPASVQQRLEAELKQVVADAAFIRPVPNLGDTVRWRTAQDTRAQVSQEIAMWQDIAQQANLTVH